MIWKILIVVVLLTIFKFIFDLNKDKAELSIGIDKKFEIIVDELNDAAFGGQGDIQHNNKRQFNLYKQPSNQIIFFHYGTGILTITWRYKYFQKEVVHERSFREVRNLSIFEQQNISNTMISEMVSIIENHQISVLGSLDSEEELLHRLRTIVSKVN